MRRKPIVVLFALFLAFSAVSVTGVQASTECSKWLTAYKQALAKSNALHRASAAKRRAQRKLVQVSTTPKTRVSPEHMRRPPMSKEEALRRFKMACGDLPENPLPPTLLSQVDAGPYVPPGVPFGPSVDLGSTDEISNLPNLDTPVYNTTPDIPPEEGGGLPGGGPVFGATPGGVPSGTSNVTPPTPPVTPVTPVTPVPEPESIALVLTGLAGAAGMLRNRLRK